jgi:hypothetical protein
MLGQSIILDNLLRLIELSFRVFNFVLRFHAVSHWMSFAFAGASNTTVWRGLKFLQLIAPASLAGQGTFAGASVMRVIAIMAFRDFLQQVTGR